MGYTSGVAEKLYKKFENDSYLTLETYPKMSREKAVEKFDNEYGIEGKPDLFINKKEDYVEGSSVILWSNTDGTYTVSQEEFDFVLELQTGGYQYDLTPTGEEKQAQGEELDEDDFNYIRLGVAGEHIGDISVWYDLINDTVGGRDFADKSVAKFTYQIDDYLSTTLDNIIYEINHN